MNAHRVETTVTEDRTLTLDNLPFPPGASVEIIILERDAAGGQAADVTGGTRTGLGQAPEAPANPYPLRGATPYRYEEPFEPVAVEDWDALQ